jgi:hypothetical protein
VARNAAVFARMGLAPEGVRSLVLLLATRYPVGAHHRSVMLCIFWADASLADGRAV